MKTISRNGVLEMVIVSEVEKKLEQMVRGFNKTQDWFELVKTYIAINGDTSKEELIKDLSTLTNTPMDITEPHVIFSISKNRAMGFVLYDGYMIYPGYGHLYLSNRTKDEILLAVGATRNIQPMSKKYNLDKIIYIQTGKRSGGKLPIYDIEKEIAIKTLKMLVNEGYLTNQDPCNYTPKLYEYMDSYNEMF